MARSRKPKPLLISKIISWTARVVAVLVLAGLVLVLVAMNKAYSAFEDVSDTFEELVQSIDLPDGSQSTRVYARDYDHAERDGALLAKLYEENRQLASYQDLPPELIACLLSTEDKNFFKHEGVDYLGMGRAVFQGIKRGGDIKGTSTVTQQLSRNVFLTHIVREKTYDRKMQEVILAMALEQRFTKQQILQAYLNHIYLGGGAYGVKSAARGYFDKNLDELTLAECALLAGLPQKPSDYDPTNPANLEEATGRRDTVLRLLKSRIGTDFFETLAQADPEKFTDFDVTANEIEAAIEEPIVVTEREEVGHMEAPYFTSYVRDHVLVPTFGSEQVLRGGLTISTTIDPLYQQWAEEIVKEKVDKYRESKRVSQAAVVLLEASTGEILACVGGYEWGAERADGQPDMYNRAMLRGRPTGSSFKPFTYATAYEQGFPPSLTIWDGPNKEITEREGKPWPKNSNGSYNGWVSVFWALQNSRNAASVDLITNCTGIEPVIDTARRMGVTANLEAVPALTLGFADIKPVEMAGAFATFANSGTFIKPITVKKVYDQHGILVASYDSQAAIQERSNDALSANTAWMMVQNMRRVVEAGTGTGARVSRKHDGKTERVQIAGKTGTNDDYADAWFVGYSPELVCAVWVGNDDYAEKMNRMFGGNLPAEIFKEVMTRVYSDQFETIGDPESDNAEKILVYDPSERWTKLSFEKPAEATFNGFPSPVVGSKLEKNEEGEFIEPDAEEDEEGEPTSGGTVDHDFYQPWIPPGEGGGLF